jgi:uncharacterized protein
MIARYRCLFIALCLSHAVFAQESGSLPNSATILQQGQELRDKGSYKEAITLFRQVSPSDTNYSQILRELAFNAMADSDFEATMRYVDTGLKRFPEDAARWYAIRGRALRKMDQMDLSLAAFGQALEQSPYNVDIRLDRGLTFFKLRRYAEAEADFQRCALISGTFSSPHYYLGLVSIQEGNMVAAMYSLMTYWLLSPDGEHAQAAAELLRAIANVTDQVSTLASARQATAEDVFDTETEILLSKAALDPKYPMQSEEDGPIVRQMQALLEKTAYRPADPGFWMQYYVPYFRDIYNTGMFNVMVHHMLSPLGIKSVDDWNSHHKKELQAFVDTTAGYFMKITSTETLFLGARDTARCQYLIENGNLGAKGWFIPGRSKTTLLAGPWAFYYSNGALKAKGNLDAREERDGDWVSYYANGSLKETDRYDHGKLIDTARTWYDNGVQDEIDPMEHNDIRGVFSAWYYNGVLREIAEYFSGKPGRDVEYSSGGFLKSSGFQMTGKYQGPDTDFYDNGKPSSIERFEKGKLDGPKFFFNRAGALVKEGAYNNGNEVGDWKTYYASGHVSETYHYDRGVLEGPDTEYYDNGHIKEVYAYSKGKQEGKEFDYTEAGRLFEEDTRDKGRVRAVQFYDSDGKPGFSASVPSSGGLITYFDSLGYKLSDGKYVYKGNNIDAYRTYYYPSGEVSGTAVYHDNNLEGPRVNYFRNGKTSDSTIYANDQQDGYYGCYYENGRLRQEGWYTAGDRQGPYREYDVFGNLTSSTYYLNGDANGYSDTYAPNGRKQTEYFYKTGWPVHLAEWDTSGELIQDRDIPPGEIEIKTRSTTAHYNHYQLEGIVESFFFDHSPAARLFYRHGLEDSTYTRYFHSGAKAAEGIYRLGSREGVWTDYFENGKPRVVSIYTNGNLQGRRTIYNEDGTRFREDTYLDDQLEGPMFHYEDSNRVSYIFYYHDGDLTGYSYLGKGLNPVPLIPLPKGAGPVTAFYPNGRKSAEFKVVDGAVDGPRTTWFSNGSVDYQGASTMGKEQGLVVRHYPNGQLASEERNYYDNLHGLCSYYYPSGVLHIVNNFYNGDLEGNQKIYDESGHLKQTMVYYYGVLQAIY